jgi:hypothetical protein
LVRGADSNAQRQLRAYLFVEPKGISFNEADGMLLVNYSVVNTGQTPAYNVRHFCSPRVMPYPLPSDPLNTIAINPSLSKVSIGAGKSSIGNGGTRVIDDGTGPNPKERIYFVGLVIYVDAFGLDHSTRWCVSIDLDKHLALAREGKTQGPITFEYTEQHNDAD